MKNPVKVRIETDVDLDLPMMAKAFAHMGGDEQAQFLALVHREMGDYTRTTSAAGRFKMGAHGRELQMLAIKDHFDEQPDAREFILSLYQMTIEDEEEPKTVLDNPPGGIMDPTFQPCCGAMWEQEHKADCPLATSRDNPPGDVMEDIRKATAAIKADTGLHPTRWIMSGEQERRWLAAASMLSPPPATRDEIQQPLKVLSESITWRGLGEEHLGELGLERLAKTNAPRVTCYCKHPTGVWFKPYDRVRVETSAHSECWGTVTKVCADGNVQVLLDMELPPAISPKEARHRNMVNVAPNVFVTYDPSKLNICGSLAYTGPGGTYIGRVVKWKDDGMVVIEVAPGVVASDPDTMPIKPTAVFDRDADESIIDFVSRNKKAVGGLITSYDLVSPSGDTKPNVAERRQCEECKGTGTWINPFNDEPSPCSRGCKS